MIETVAHIVSGCSVLAGTLYKKHHDEVGQRLHWCLCSQFGFPVVRDWWKHNPRPVEKSDCVKILWDFTVITDRTIHANCPDLILLLKEERHAFLVDFSYPFDSNVVSKEAEKVDKYQDLLTEIQRLWHVKADVINCNSYWCPWCSEPQLTITLKLCVLQKSVLLQTAGLLR